MRSLIKPLKSLVYFLPFLLICALHTAAQPGKLDSSFNGTGRAFTYPAAGFGSMMGYCNAIQPDGKLLVGGSDSSYNATIIRYNQNGTRDFTFAQTPRISMNAGSIPSEFYSICVQPDGKILAGGVAGGGVAVLVRFKTNGTPDSSFGLAGRIFPNLTGSSAIRFTALSANGGIVVGGSSDDGSFVLKYHSNGVLNSDFGDNGLLILGAAEGFRLELLANGSFYTTGKDRSTIDDSITISRYRPDGRRDSAFNQNGIVKTYVDSMGASGLRVKMQADRKILVVGIIKRTHPYINVSFGTDFFMVRYSQSGLVDSSFGRNGVVKANIDQSDQPAGVAIQDDGKILLGGTSDVDIIAEGYYVLARFHSSGKPDSSFGVNGVVKYFTNSFEGVCYGMQFSGNRVYMSGWANSLQPMKTGMNTFVLLTDVVPYSPSVIDLCPPASSATLLADLNGASYQWQVSTDSILFTNIVNGMEYSGATSAQLSLNSISSLKYGNRYRCLVDNGISSVYTLRFRNTWTGSISSDWENSANWSCGALPDPNTDVLINTGSLRVNSNVIVRSLRVGAGAGVTVAPGATLTVLR